MMFGHCYEADVRASKHDMKLLKDMGIDFIRLSVNADHLMTAPGIYDWRRVDASMNAVVDAGLKVYWNWTWLPAFASGGVPAYREYWNGCAVPTPVQPGDWTGRNWRYATREEKPYCYPPNIPHIDAQYVYWLGFDAAKRYRTAVEWWGAWNEPGGPWYWPPIVEPPYEEGVNRLFDEVVVPFTHGVRDALGAVKFIGPEADGEDIFRRCLEKDTLVNVYDIVSFHPYSWGTFPEDSYTRTRKFVDIAKSLTPKEIWTTEVTDETTGRIVEWTAEMLRRFPEISAHTFFDAPQWLQAFNTGNAVPTQKYRDMQMLISTHKKRRAVRS